MTITLYDLKDSIHAAYARVVLDSIGIEYTKIDVQLPFNNIKPEYAAINKQLSVPAMTVEGEKIKDVAIYTDSRDIIMYCATVPGGDKLFPKDKVKEIEEILDQIYSANGGELAFQYQKSRDPIFSIALDVIGNIRGRLLKSYRDDPKNTNLKDIYEDAVNRASHVDDNLDDLIDRANKVMLFLDSKLEKSNGSWLLGSEYTAADGVAAVWVQWIVWTNNPKIVLSSRVLEFLSQVKKRPVWKVTDPAYAVSDITSSLYPLTALFACSIVGCIAFAV